MYDISVLLSVDSTKCVSFGWLYSLELNLCGQIGTYQEGERQMMGSKDVKAELQVSR